MNFDLTDDQTSVLDSLDQLLGGFKAPSDALSSYCYSKGLADALAESDFLSIADTEGFGLLDAALVVERVARATYVVEVGSTLLISPLSAYFTGKEPMAITDRDLSAPIRFLPFAQSLIVLDEGGVGLVTIANDAVEPMETLLAYPFGRFKEKPQIRRLDVDAAAIRRRWRIAIANEIAGSMASALNIVLEHVQVRRAFDRPLGAFQAIQHRLSMAAETLESSRWLARRAAWSDSEEDAALAAGFAQSRISKFAYDLHQFSGAMGLTLEYPLHFWTYRLRALAGELGGTTMQARALAAAAWPDTE